MFKTASLLLIPITIFVASPQLAAVDMKDKKQRQSYELGVKLGKQYIKKYGKANYDAMVEGIKSQAPANFAERRDAGLRYLAENKQRDGVVETKSGLQYEIMVKGSGATPKATDKVSVHYKGTLIDGTEFDSSHKRGKPVEFQLHGVIPGWTEGLQLMNVGSTYRFVIPSKLAYGENGAGSVIGPGETLIFEVELLNIL